MARNVDFPARHAALVRSEVVMQSTNGTIERSRPKPDEADEVVVPKGCGRGK
jgi:hypothetical protein